VAERHKTIHDGPPARYCPLPAETRVGGFVLFSACFVLIAARGLPRASLTVDRPPACECASELAAG